MAKYDWGAIKKYFDSLVDAGVKNPQAETRKKFGVPAGTLGSRIANHNWVLSKEQNDALEDFKTANANITESFSKANERQKELILDRVQTTLEDNALIANNRKLLALAQQVIANGKKDINLKNIKTITGAIRDIEAVANPKAGAPVVAVQNNNTGADNNTTEIVGYEVTTLE